MIACCIFDLDGVIVDTASFHYEAWRELACALGFEFTPEEGEKTKGVSRMDSLEIVLRAGGMETCFTPVQKETLSAAKNARYLERVAEMTPTDVLPGVRDFLTELRRRGLKVVLGSASKNARTILVRCALEPFFDVIVDGTMISRAKPDPEVFATGAQRVSIPATQCVVFEDAAAGIEAARRAGMRSVGVGGGSALVAATMRIASFDGFTYDKLMEGIEL